MHRREKKRWSSLRSLPSFQILLHGEDEAWTGFKAPPRVGSASPDVSNSNKVLDELERVALEESGLQAEFASYVGLAENSEPELQQEVKATPQVDAEVVSPTLAAPTKKVAQAKQPARGKQLAQVESAAAEFYQVEPTAELTQLEPTVQSPEVLSATPVYQLDFDSVRIGEFFAIVPFEESEDRSKVYLLEPQAKAYGVIDHQQQNFTAANFFSVLIPWDGADNSNGPDLASLMGMATRDAIGRASRFKEPALPKASCAGEFFTNINWLGELQSAT